MMASVNSLYDTRQWSSAGPAMVREPTGVRLDADPAPSGLENAPNRPESAPNRAAGNGDDDELRKLGERIAELAARINSAEARMMTLICEFDRRGGWKDGGYSSCAEWLAWRIGTKIGTARERVRTARALERLSRTADALREGTISYAKVRALTRVATPETRGGAARVRARGLGGEAGADGAHVEEAVARRGADCGAGPAPQPHFLGLRGRRRDVRGEGPARARSRGRADAGGGGGVGCAVPIRGRCPRRGGTWKGCSRRGRRCAPGAEAAPGGCGGAARGAGAGCGIRRWRAPANRRAMRTRWVATSMNWMVLRPPNPDAALRGAPAETPGAKAENAANTSARVRSGTRAERYQVMVHCDAATLAAEGEPGRSDLDGIRVSAETSRRMACDAAVVAMVHAKDGSMLNVGRRTRTIPPHIRRALEERDRGCRFPGCGCRFTEAHHVKHWADGGETSLGNTLLLCRRHHRAVHEGRVKVSVNSDGTVLFFTPKGRMLVDAPSRPKAARGGERPDLPPVPAVHPGAPAEASVASLPVPAVHPNAPAKGGDFALSNGAALYPDSQVPWEIEAAAREAMEDSLES